MTKLVIVLAAIGVTALLAILCSHLPAYHRLRRVVAGAGHT